MVILHMDNEASKVRKLDASHLFPVMYPDAPCICKCIHLIRVYDRLQDSAARPERELFKTQTFRTRPDVVHHDHRASRLTSARLRLSTTRLPFTARRRISDTVSTRQVRRSKKNRMTTTLDKAASGECG
jgi:hypothetical protein